MTYDLIFRLPLAPVAMIARAWTVVVNRRKTAELFDLSDSQLRDIGLTRRDIQLALRGGPLSDPTPRLDDYASGKRLPLMQPLNPPVQANEAAHVQAATPVSKAGGHGHHDHKAAA